MRVMGIRAEITGPCLSVGESSLTMDVDGEDFGADVMCANIDLRNVGVGDHVFVVGRVSLTNFDPKARRVFVQAERIDVLDPLTENRFEENGDGESVGTREEQYSSPVDVVTESAGSEAGSNLNEDA